MWPALWLMKTFLLKCPLFHQKSVPNFRCSISSSQGRVSPMSGSGAFHGGAAPADLQRFQFRENPPPRRQPDHPGIAPASVDIGLLSTLQTRMVWPPSRSRHFRHDFLATIRNAGGFAPSYGTAWRTKPKGNFSAGKSTFSTPQPAPQDGHACRLSPNKNFPARCEI